MALLKKQWLSGQLSKALPKKKTDICGTSQVRSQLGTVSGRGMAIPTNREGGDFTSLPMYILGTCYHEKEASRDGEDGWMAVSNTRSSPEPWSSDRKNDKSVHKAQVQVGFPILFYFYCCSAF